eukprot:COSAG01_NODE_14674_length_1423_cov_1.396526_3_plen_144_part_00
MAQRWRGNGEGEGADLRAGAEVGAVGVVWPDTHELGGCLEYLGLALRAAAMTVRASAAATHSTTTQSCMSAHRRPSLLHARICHYSHLVPQLAGGRGNVAALVVADLPASRPVRFWPGLAVPLISKEAVDDTASGEVLDRVEV